MSPNHGQEMVNDSTDHFLHPHGYDGGAEALHQVRLQVEGAAKLLDDEAHEAKAILAAVGYQLRMIAVLIKKDRQVRQ